MAEVFLFALNAILPLILEILLGVLLNKAGILKREFFVACRKYVFFVAVPAMVFCSIYNTEGFSAVNSGMMLFVFVTVMVLFCIGLVVALLCFPDNREKGVIIQCVYRSNFNIIAVPLAQSLGGAAGLECIALLTTTTIPQFNILAVIALSLFAVEGKPRRGFGGAVRDIVKNPLIIACIGGVACLLLRPIIPIGANGAAVFSLEGTLPFLHSTITAIGKTATPMALIALGGLFNAKALRGRSAKLIGGTMLRVIVAPIIAIGGAWTLSQMGVLTVGAAEYACLIAIFASPVATISGVMAAQMGSDDVLSDQLVVTTTVVSAFTIFGIVCVMRGLGML